VIKYFLPYGLVKLISRLKNKEKNNPARYKSGVIVKGDFTFNYPDYPSFRFTYDEIFNKKIYDFNFEGEAPFIIDGGTNIGLAAIFWKSKFPKCKIIAIEADSEIIEYARQNFLVNSLNSGISIINKALWKDNKGVRFSSEGADAGLITENKGVLIPTINLEELADGQKIDYLKLDIEGAELEVLINSQKILINTEKIFIEYHSFINEKQKLSILLNLLEKYNYRYHINSPGLSSFNPFISLNTYLGMDLQLNIFAWKKE
jgi:FkbM family methyltransferase